MMMEIDGNDLIDTYYPGLSQVERKQTVIFGAAISATAAEAALIEVANTKDVGVVRSLFQSRINYQVGDGDEPGGAWYPQTTEAWRNNSRVVSRGNYVMLIVSDNCDAIVDSFKALF